MPREQPLGQAVGDGHRAAGAEVGLSLARVLATHISVPDANPLCGPVDVTPPQPEQLGLAKPGVGGREHDRAQHRPEYVRRYRRRRAARASPCRLRASPNDRIGKCGDDGLDLVHGEELQIGVGITASSLRTCGSRDRVGRAPSALDAQGEGRVQEGRDVPNRLRRRPALKHASHQTLHMGRRHGGRRERADRRGDVDPLHRGAVLAVRQPRALDLQSLAKCVDQVVDGSRAFGRGRQRARCLDLDQPLQHTLGLCPRHAIGRAAHADLADAPVEEPAVDGAPSSVVGPPLHVEMTGPRGRFIARYRPVGGAFAPSAEHSSESLFPACSPQ